MSVVMVGSPVDGPQQKLGLPATYTWHEKEDKMASHWPWYCQHLNEKASGVPQACSMVRANKPREDTSESRSHPMSFIQPLWTDKSPHIFWMGAFCSSVCLTGC